MGELIGHVEAAPLPLDSVEEVRSPTGLSNDSVDLVVFSCPVDVDRRRQRFGCSAEVRIPRVVMLKKAGAETQDGCGKGTRADQVCRCCWCRVLQGCGKGLGL